MRAPRYLARIVDVGLPLAIGAIALAARTINLENWPRWFVDEGTQGVTAFYLLQGIWGMPPVAPNFFPPLTPPLAALSILAFGQNYLAIRLPSAVAGAVGCLLVYAIGRRWYGARVGVVAGLLMAVSYASIYMDRMAMKDAIMGMLMLGAVACLLEARQGSRRWAIAAGVLGGLAFLAKYTAAIFVVFATLELLRKRRLDQLGYLLAAFVPVALVYLVEGALIGWQTLVTDVAIQAGLFGLAQTFRETVQVLIQSNPIDQLRWGTQFSINFWTTTGFVLLFYLAARKREGDTFLLLWALSGIAALVFATPTYWMHLLPLIPVYYLAMAIAFNDLWEQRREGGIHFWALGLLLLLMALAEFGLRRVVPGELVNYVQYFFLAGAALMGLDLAAQGVLPTSHGLIARIGWATRGLAVVLLAAVVLAAGAWTLQNITKNEVSDQKATVRFLQSQLWPEDMVAAANPIVFPLGVNGFAYTWTAYLTFSELDQSFPREWFPRFTQDMSLSAFRFVVVDSPLRSLPGRQAGPALIEKVENEWVLRFQSGDYKVYENPVRPRFKEVPFLDDDLAQGVTVGVTPADHLAVSNDAAEKTSGQNSLRLDLDLKGANSIYLYQAAQPQDWSAYREITFWWYGAKVGVVAVDILAPDWVNYYHLVFVDNWEGWRQVRLTLAKDSPSGKASWKVVRTLALKFQSLPVQGTVRLDDLRLYGPK